MTILHVLPAYYPAVIYGGTTFWAWDVTNKLAEAGLDIKVSTTNVNGKGKKLEKETGVWLKIKRNLKVKYYNETISERLSFPLLFNLGGDIKKASIIHVQGIFHSILPISLFYAIMYKKPICVSPHGNLGKWGLKQSSLFKKIFLNLFVRPFNRYIHWHATCLQEENEIKSLFYKPKVTIIPNGIEISSFANNSKKLDKIQYLKKFINIEPQSKHPKVITFLSRLHKKKRSRYSG